MLSRSLFRTFNGALPLQSAFPKTFATSTAAAASLKRTALYDAHIAQGAKMVDFAGYELPVKYDDSIINSHKHCRGSASIFDVSHMGQIKMTGAKRVQFMETLCVGDLLAMKAGESKLSVLTNEDGGAIDDFIISTKADHIYMVVNGGCKDKDMALIKTQLAKFNSEQKADVRMEYLSDRALIALQGPHAMSVLQALIPQSVDLTKMPFMTTTETFVSGLPCLVTRCGYTGEDGFEVSVANTSAISLWQTFLKDKRVLAAGLGVRDSLRLEAGLCLYGHELNETITPVEAGLLWTIGKRRREEGGFLGAAKIQEQIKNGAAKKLCGLIVNGGAPAREGSDILDAAGNKIGVVTSGVPAPSLDMKKIAMGYIDMPHNKVGTQLTVSVRGKVNPAEVVKMPFVPSQYYRLP